MIVEIENDEALKKGDAKGLMLEIAISIYKKNDVGMGFAADLAGLSRLEFQKQLAKRHIEINFSKEMLLQDMDFAKSFGT